MTKKIKNFVERYLAIFMLSFAYLLGISVSKLFKRLQPKKTSRKRIIINGTFHNPNWFFAHIEPIVCSNYGEVILVCDEPIQALPNLKYSCPPYWLGKIISRALAKFIYTLLNGIRYPADIYVGYHIFPSALTALICARLLGSKCCYQVTSGQLELEGGGWYSENRLLTMLGKPSKLIEKLASNLTNEFELVVVRGTRARDYLRVAGVDKRIEMVTGSVITDASSLDGIRDTDIIFVGRLTEYKRPEIFIEIASKVVAKFPNCVIQMVGDGPDYNSLADMIKQMNIGDNVTLLGKRTDVPDLLSKSKLLVMTSRWEGVSIAMLEAMAMGVVPVVSDVGDLRDYVVDDKTGYVLDKDDVEGYAEKIEYLLNNQEVRKEMSKACHEKVENTSSKAVITQRWHQLFSDIN